MQIANRKIGIVIVVLACGILFCCNSGRREIEKETGGEIYAKHCRSCHLLGGTDNHIMNPTQIKRFYSDTFLLAFLRYPDKTIKEHFWAREMNEKFGGAKHPSFLNQLTREQIMQLAVFLADFAKNNK